jgi:hypothetical protein
MVAMAKKRTLNQREKFVRAARELGTDDNEKRVNERLGKGCPAKARCVVAGPESAPKKA